MREAPYFTEENVRTVLQMAQQGCTRSQIAAKVGMTPSSLGSWLARGKKNPESSYGLFARAYNALKQSSTNDETKRVVMMGKIMTEMEIDQECGS